MAAPTDRELEVRWLLAHRELQLLRSCALGRHRAWRRRYIARREALLEEASREAARHVKDRAGA